MLHTKNNASVDFQVLGWLLSITALMVIFIAFFVFDERLAKPIKSYVAHGALVGYQDITSGRVRHMYVTVLQSDGVVRQYNTDIHPEQCKQHVLGIDVPLQVTIKQSLILKEEFKEINFLKNPCV